MTLITPTTRQNLPAHSFNEAQLTNFNNLIRLIGLMDQIETFDVIRQRYIPTHYNHMLRTRDHKVPKRRWAGFASSYLLEDIEVDAKDPPTIIRHPLSNRSKEVNDYKIGSYVITGSSFSPALTPEQPENLRYCVCDSDIVLYLNGNLFFSANLWRPRFSQTIPQIVGKMESWKYTKNPPLIFNKKNYFKENILQSALEIINEYPKSYSDLKIHTVYHYDDSEEVNLFIKSLEKFFTDIPNFNDLKYYY